MALHRLPYCHGFLECDLPPADARGLVVETLEPSAAAPDEIGRAHV